jgi:hypothetical protein
MSGGQDRQVLCSAEYQQVVMHKSDLAGTYQRILLLHLCEAQATITGGGRKY